MAVWSGGAERLHTTVWLDYVIADKEEATRDLRSVLNTLDVMQRLGESWRFCSVASFCSWGGMAGFVRAGGMAVLFVPSFLFFAWHGAWRGVVGVNIMCVEVANLPDRQSPAL